MLVARIPLIALGFALGASAQLGPRVAGTVKAGAGGLALGAATAAIISKTNKPLSKASKVESNVESPQVEGPTTPQPASDTSDTAESTKMSLADSVENPAESPSTERPTNPPEGQPSADPAPRASAWEKRGWVSSSWTVEPTRVRPVAPRTAPPPAAKRVTHVAGAPTNRTVQARPAAPRPSRPSGKPRPQQQATGQGASVRSDVRSDLYVGAAKPVPAVEAPAEPTLPSELTQLGLEIGMSIEAATKILGKPHITMRGLFSRSHNEKYVFKKPGRDIVIYARDGNLGSGQKQLVHFAGGCHTG